MGGYGKEADIMNQSHTQANTDTHTHANTHTQANIHTHTHTHTETKKVLDRLSRAIGHMEAVKKMVEEGRDCSEILVQIAAVRSAVNNIGKIILKDHIDHCVVDAVETGDRKVLEDLSEAIDRFVK